MVSITLSVPEDVKKRMDSFPEMNWSGFVRQKIIEKIEALGMNEELLRAFEQEKDIREWAVKLQRKMRKGRYAELKKAGVL